MGVAQSPHRMAVRVGLLGQPLLGAHALHGEFVGLGQQGQGLLDGDHLTQRRLALGKHRLRTAKGGQQPTRGIVAHAIAQAQAHPSAQFVFGQGRGVHACLLVV